MGQKRYRRLGIRGGRCGSGAPIAIFVEVAPEVFRSPDHVFSIAFRSDAAGHITHSASSSGVFERVPWYRIVAFQRGLGLGCGLVFLLGMLGVPFLALRRRGSLRHASGRPVRAVTLMAWLTATLNLIFLIGLVMVLSQAYQLGLEYGMPTSLQLLFWLPRVTTILAMIRCSSVRRAYMLLLLAVLAFISFLSYWNLLAVRI